MLELLGLYKIFKSLDVHEQLALVVVGASSPDSPVVDFGLERIGIPLLQRLGRLDIVVAVNHNGLGLRVYHFLAEDYRVAGCRINVCLVCSGLFKQFNESFGAL